MDESIVWVGKGLIDWHLKLLAHMCRCIFCCNSLTDPTGGNCVCVCVLQFIKCVCVLRCTKFAPFQMHSFGGLVAFDFVRYLARAKYFSIAYSYFFLNQVKPISCLSFSSCPSCFSKKQFGCLFFSTSFCLSVCRSQRRESTIDVGVLS